jgi:phosphate uptake regulator
MREAFRDQLVSVFDDLVVMCGKVQQSVQLSTEALLTGDAAKAERVISADAHLDTATQRSRTVASRCSPSSSRWPETCESSSRH